LLVLAYAVGWLISVRFQIRRSLNLARQVNKRVTNPAAMLVAGRAGIRLAVVRHVGRRSGQPYATPVWAEPVAGGFIIPLFYGLDVDWLRNVRAAGQFTLELDGAAHAVGSPEVIDRAAGLPLVSPTIVPGFRALGIPRYLKVTEVASIRSQSASQEA
jgi:deazaflavin-dependent oxidoreductase (nitroreductase family)